MRARIRLVEALITTVLAAVGIGAIGIAFWHSLS